MRVWFTLAFALAAMLFARPSDAQQSGTIDNEGVVLHYSTVGNGSPVVLLSGGPGFSSAYMAPLAALLAPDHLVIIPDLRGTGRSQPTKITSATVNSPLILDDLEALRSHLGIERWDVIGHSFGSLLGMRYALAHPGSVDRLVLLAAMAPKYSMATFAATLDERTTPEEMARLKQIANAYLEAKTDAERDRLNAESAVVSLPGYFADPAAIPKLLEAAGPNIMTDATFQVLQKEAAGYDLRSQLGSLKTPTLIVQGEADPLTLAAETRDAIPGARLIIVPGAGHFSWVEKPEQVRAAISEFLDKGE